MPHVPFFPSLEGVCLWHPYGVAAFLQQVAVLRPVDRERPAAVHWLALRGCCDGQLVWQGWVWRPFLWLHYCWVTESARTLNWVL